MPLTASFRLMVARCPCVVDVVFRRQYFEKSFWKTMYIIASDTTDAFGHRRYIYNKSKAWINYEHKLLCNITVIRQWNLKSGRCRKLFRCPKHSRFRLKFGAIHCITIIHADTFDRKVFAVLGYLINLIIKTFTN